MREVEHLVASDNIRVATVAYGKEAQVLFDFNEYVETLDVQRAFSTNLVFHSLQMLGIALETALHMQYLG